MTREWSAPSAMRTPSSRVRLATENDVYAVDAEHRQRERHEAERAGDGCRQPLRQQAEVRDFRNGAMSTSGKMRIDFQQRLTDGRHE